MNDTKTVKLPCGHHIREDMLLSLAGRVRSSRRTTPTGGRMNPPGGRPRKDAPRCPCGANTLRRAEARCFDCCRRAGIEPPAVQSIG